MIACICNAITDQDIKDCIKDCSDRDSHDVVKCLDIGSSCGICMKDMRERINKIKEEVCQKNY